MADQTTTASTTEVARNEHGIGHVHSHEPDRYSSLASIPARPHTAWVLLAGDRHQSLGSYHNRFEAVKAVQEKLDQLAGGGLTLAAADDTTGATLTVSVRLNDATVVLAISDGFGELGARLDADTATRLAILLGNVARDASAHERHTSRLNRG